MLDRSLNFFYLTPVLRIVMNIRALPRVKLHFGHDAIQCCASSAYSISVSCDVQEERIRILSQLEAILPSSFCACTERTGSNSRETKGQAQPRPRIMHAPVFIFSFGAYICSDSVLRLRNLRSWLKSMLYPWMICFHGVECNLSDWIYSTFGAASKPRLLRH